MTTQQLWKGFLQEWVVVWGIAMVVVGRGGVVDHNLFNSLKLVGVVGMFVLLVGLLVVSFSRLKK